MSNQVRHSASPAPALIENEDERSLAAITREWVTRHEPARSVRERADQSSGYDRATWSRACQQLGIGGVTIAEPLGGAGLPRRALSVVCEAAGTQLALEPLIPTVAMAGTALQMTDAGSDRDSLLAGIASGEVLAALACGAPRGPFGLNGHVSASGEGVLNGSVPVVVGAAQADVLVVIASADGVPALFCVQRAAPGVTVRRLETLDLARPSASVEFNSVPGTKLTRPGGAFDVETCLSAAATHLLAEQAGAMSMCLDMAVEYARTRVQFGRTIGSFQAVKHRCVDMLTDLETARSHGYAARAELDREPAALRVAASAARLAGGQAGRAIAASALHVHGGIGFTWEHNAHLYLRRAKSTEGLLGTTRAHLDFLAAHLGLNGQNAPTRETA